MSIALLFVLATIDGTLIGHHAAIGANPLVNKGSYWVRACLRGFAASQASLALVGAVTCVAFGMSADRASLWADAEVAATAMSWVFLPYAALVLAALGFYLTPYKALANILVLGPFTLLRTPLVVGAVAVGVAVHPRWEIAMILLTACCTTLAIKPYLRRHPPRW